MDPNVKMIVNESTEEKSVSASETKMGTQFEYVDEQTLKERYESRPDSLAHMLVHAPKFMCPFQGCNLYGIPTYAKGRMDTQDNTNTT